MKKIIAVLLVMTIFSVSAFATGVTQIIRPGDVDGDGAITAADARLALRYSSRLIELWPNRARAADAIEDGEITAADARRILRWSSRLDTETLPEWARYTPAPLEPVELSAEQISGIKEEWLAMFYCGNEDNYKFRYFTDLILTCYGAYSDNIVVKINMMHQPGWIEDFRRSETVAGVTFVYYDMAGLDNIWLWDGEELITIKSAYEQGLLTRENLRDISYYNHSYPHGDVVWSGYKKPQKRNDMPQGAPVEFTLGSAKNIHSTQYSFYLQISDFYMTIAESLLLLESIYAFDAEDNGPDGYNYIKGYTDEFFADKAVVLLYFTESSGSYRHEVELVKDGDTLCAVISRGDSVGVTDDVAYWIYLMEVDVSDIAAITSLECFIIK